MFKIKIKTKKQNQTNKIYGIKRERAMVYPRLNLCKKQIFDSVKADGLERSLKLGLVRFQVLKGSRLRALR